MINIDRDKDFKPMMNRIMTKLKDLEGKIELVKSDTASIIKESNKKKVK